MPCKSETREIDGKDVFVMQLPATAAMELQIETYSVIGDTCLPFVKGEWTFGNILYIQKVSDRDALIQLIKYACGQARIDGQELKGANFDLEFSGNLLMIYKVFAFVLEVNFKDFFTQGLGLQKPAAESAK